MWLPICCRASDERREPRVDSHTSSRAQRRIFGGTPSYVPRAARFPNEFAVPPEILRLRFAQDNVARSEALIDRELEIKNKLGLHARAAANAAAIVLKALPPDGENSE